MCVNNELNISVPKRFIFIITFKECKNEKIYKGYTILINKCMKNVFSILLGRKNKYLHNSPHENDFENDFDSLVNKLQWGIGGLNVSLIQSI